MLHGIKIQVECYSGHTANERPLRFIIGENAFEVIDIADRWYGPDHLYFKVRADDGNIYILKHIEDEDKDEWELEYFMKSGE